MSVANIQALNTLLVSRKHKCRTVILKDLVQVYSDAPPAEVVPVWEACMEMGLPHPEIIHDGRQMRVSIRR